MVIYIINGDNNFCLWGTCTSCKVLPSHRIKHAVCSKSLPNIIYDMGLLFALFSIFRPLYLIRKHWHVFFCIVFFPPSFSNFVCLLIHINNFNIIQKRLRKPTGVKQWFPQNRVIVVQLLFLWKCSGIRCHPELPLTVWWVCALF